MGLRFRKSVGLAPGLKINFSKGMPSLSIGGKGLTFNIGKKGTKTTVGLPGTGLSYSTDESHQGKGSGKPMLWVAIVALLFYAAKALLNP